LDAVAGLERDGAMRLVGGRVDDRLVDADLEVAVGQSGEFYRFSGKRSGSPKGEKLHGRKIFSGASREKETSHELLPNLENVNKSIYSPISQFNLYNCSAVT
jgi:hypothetical protein